MIRIELCVVYFIFLTACCAGKSIKPTCDFATATAHMSQLYYTTSVAMNKLTTIGKKELPQFWPKRCRGYLSNNKSPFPTASLTRSVKEFKGPKFFPQSMKVFLPFVLAINNVLNKTNVPAQAPLDNLMDNINIYVLELLECLGKGKPVVLPTIRYNATVHKADVQSCLKKAKVKPTPRKVQLLQYGGIMDKLYGALRKMRGIISDINSG